MDDESGEFMEKPVAMRRVRKLLHIFDYCTYFTTKICQNLVVFCRHLKIHVSCHMAIMRKRDVIYKTGNTMYRNAAGR